MLRVFPVDPAAKPKFSDTWGAAREGGRTHEGTDIFAPEDSPVYAVDDGKVSGASSEIGGLVVHLDTADGTRYYYAHLSGFANAPWPRNVKAGDLIGYVGHTGNAAHTQPHLHFGIYPAGGGAVNPFEALSAVAPGALATSSSSSSSSSPKPAASRSSSSSSKLNPAGVLLALWVLHELAKG